MKTHRIYLALFLFGIFASPLISQKTMQKADKQYSLKAYDLAVANYTKVLDENPECNQCIYMIAESYRMMNRNVEAALWFRKLDGVSDVPADFDLKYGLVLKRMGQYDKAQDLFYAHKLIDPIIGEHYAQSCDFAKSNLSDEMKFEVSLLRTNSKSSEFAPTFFKNQIVYSSFRTDLKRSESVANKSYIQNNSPQLFICDKGRLTDRDAVSFFRSDMEEDFGISVASISGNNRMCAFTKCNLVDGFRHIDADEMDMSLTFASVSEDGSLNDEKAFKYNEIGYATGFAALNHNGTIMYFASNRPGGFGGFDLYVSYFKDGEWTYPDNLGNRINTPGNEVTPFFDGERLTFSSDYHHGLGGFDVFDSKVENGEWGFPTNLGNGVNSPEDDLYLAVDPQTKTYYLSSNRIGGRGNHDIYYAVPVFQHDLAQNDNAIESDGMVPKAVSIMELAEKPMESTGSDMVYNVNDTEQVDMAVEHTNKPIFVKKEVVDLKGKKEPTKTKMDQVTDEEIANVDPNKPPAAVKITNNTVKENTTTTARPVAAKSTTVVAKNTISLGGARKVAMGEVIRSSSDVYFIQLAALFNNAANINEFNTLSNYGSIYKMYENSATKVKLGYYLDRYEADEILNKVKNAGFHDAFITYGPLNTSAMELATSPTDSGSSWTSTGSSQYKVRLAAYEDPMHFDVNQVKDIGVIEQWTKQNWTIFILSGFNSLQEAENAQIKALNRGYSEAEIVVDNNGVLEKLTRN